LDLCYSAVLLLSRFPDLLVFLSCLADRPSTEGSRGIFLVSCFTRVMFRGVWKLHPPALSLHSPSITKPSSQELPRPNHQPVCPPSNVIAPTSVELPGRKGNPSKGTQQLSSQNCAHPVSFKSLWEKDK
ncbi:hypothetical protein AMECASPLE_024812, partial [Ameca splendens]